MKEQKNILVTKASGEREGFDPAKLAYSLKRSGASEENVNHIVSQINSILYNGISTKKIYQKAFALLRKSSRHTAAKYKLKNAIYELGPSGFPFEKFVGKILHYEGYNTTLNVIAKGHCVTHEVDVVAEKENKHFMVECKFHIEPGNLCDVKVPLYIHSRFEDLEKQWLKQTGEETQFHQGWIVTNTRFSKDAIQYGKCSGLNLVGWNYPHEGNLKQRIDAAGLHPITCLTSLNKAEKTQILNKGLVLCIELCEQPQILERLGLKGPRINRILTEARTISNKTK